MEPFLEFQDIDEDYVNLETDSSAARLFSFLNKTNTLGFAYPNRFNHTFVAFLSGAILFALVNAAGIAAGHARVKGETQGTAHRRL